MALHLLEAPAELRYHFQYVSSAKAGHAQTSLNVGQCITYMQHKGCRCMQEGAATAMTAPPQDDSLLLPSGARMPLVGFGTYKVDKADSVRYASFCSQAHAWMHHTNTMQVLGQIECQPFLKHGVYIKSSAMVDICHTV